MSQASQAQPLSHTASHSGRSHNTALAGIDVAIIASPHIAMPLAQSGAGLGELGLDGADADEGKPPRRAAFAPPQNLLECMLSHLAAAGAKRASLCIGADARGIWTDRDYHQRSDQRGQNPAAAQDKAARNFNTELSWALSDLSPHAGRAWPLHLDWAVDWRGSGNLALLSMAVPLMRSNPVLVLAGDRFMPTDFAAFLAKHRRGGEQATLLCREMDETTKIQSEKLRGNGHKDGGEIVLDANGRVAKFGTTANERSYVLGGMYLFDPDYLTQICQAVHPSLIEPKSWSLEQHVLAEREAGSFAAFVDSAPIYWPYVKNRVPKPEKPQEKIVAFPGAAVKNARLLAARPGL